MLMILEHYIGCVAPPSCNTSCDALSRFSATLLLTCSSSVHHGPAPQYVAQQTRTWEPTKRSKQIKHVIKSLLKPTGGRGFCLHVWCHFAALRLVCSRVSLLGLQDLVLCNVFQTKIAANNQKTGFPLCTWAWAIFCD